MSSKEKAAHDPLIPGGWRLATEELPDEGQQVIVAATHTYAPNKSRRLTLKCEHVERGTFRTEGISWPISARSVSSEIYYRVTHWAPLPTLPERLDDLPEKGEPKPGTDKRIRNMTPDG